MTTFRTSSLLALMLVACTSLDAREPSGPIAQNPDTTTTTKTSDPKIPDTTTTPDGAPVVKIAVASVLLEQDCPDPQVEPASPRSPAVIAPPPSEKPAATPARPGDAPSGPSAVAYRRACQQSTLQLKLTNTGSAEAKIRIASIELRDVQSSSVLVPIKSRLPSVWSDGATYNPWNERIASKAEINASYRLTPPEWSTVDSKLGGVDSHGRQFELEVTVEVDGKPITVRSPAFARAPEMVMPPT